MPFEPVTATDPRLSASVCVAELGEGQEMHRNPWFEVRNRSGYYTVEFTARQSVILPVVDGDAVVMVRVKRPVIGDTPLELPAGGAEAGEAAVETVRRELAEETGIAVADVARFHREIPIAGLPNRDPRLIDVWRVDLSRDEFDRRNPHDHEVTGVELFSRAQVRDLIRRGVIYIALPLAVIQRWLLEEAE